MNVVVLGGHGRLGSAIVASLNAKKHSYLAPARQHGDVTKSSVVQAALGLAEKVAQRPVTHLINCVAFHDTKLCEADPGKAFQLNAEAPLEMARLCASRDIVFVHVSTDYVFGGMPPALLWGGYRADEAPAPVNLYGASKLAGELLILAEYSNTLIVRVSSLFGSPSDRGDFVKLVRARVLADEPMTVVDDVVMTPTYTVDAAHSLINRVLPAGARGLLHLTNTGPHYTWYEFAWQIADHCGAGAAFILPIVLKESGDPVPRPPTSALISCSVADMPDWQPGLVTYLERLDKPATV